MSQIPVRTTGLRSGQQHGESSSTPGQTNLLHGKDTQTQRVPILKKTTPTNTRLLLKDSTPIHNAIHRSGPAIHRSGSAIQSSVSSIHMSRPAFHPSGSSIRASGPAIPCSSSGLPVERVAVGDVGNKNQSLKLLLSVVNANLDELDRNQPLTLKDLETLTPELLRKLIIFLLCETQQFTKAEFHPTKAGLLDKDYTLKRFENIYYDPTINHLYWRVKKLFPPKDDTFDYSILYFPSLDPKRTKAVLHYLTTYVYFTEQISEKFSITHDQCRSNINEIEECLEEIESVKTQLNAKIVEIEDWNCEISKLEEDNQNAIKQHQAIEEKVALLEEKVNVLRKEYESLEYNNEELENQLKSSNNKLKILEEQRVHNAGLTIQKYKDEQELLDRALKKREELGKQMEKMGEIDNFTENVVEEAAQFASVLEEFVLVMQKSVDLAEKAFRIENQNRSTKEHLENILGKVKDTEITKTKLRVKYSEIRQNLLAEKNSQIQKLANLQSELEKKSSHSESYAVKMQELLAKKTNILANIQNIEIQITKNKHHMEVIIPRKFEELMVRTKEALQELKRPLTLKISRYAQSLNQQ